MDSLTILLVEDEDKMRNVLKIYLENEGYHVVEAVDGSEACMLLKGKKYSLIILDIMLPEVDGLTLCKEIRKNSSVPIIFLTARSEEFDKLLGFELGADDYITKPFSPKEFVARVNAIIRRSHNNTIDYNCLVLNSVKINLNSKQVFIDHKEIFLTPKEYELLYFLAKNPNKVFSREQLLNYVWGYDFLGDLRTVDTHIKQLRAKLGDCKDYIHTVWGSGYMLKAGN
ncbi:MAG: response regulator transcription factor [Peptococcaceae bacterium]